jgi:hypothetical protein
MTDPFLPPSSPQVTVMERTPGYWQAPSLPEPPKRKRHRVRNVLIGGGALIVAAGIGSAISNPEEAPQAAPAATEAPNTIPVVTKAPEATQAPVTVPATEAPSITTEAPVLPVITAPDTPTWVNDETMTWATEVSDLMGDTADLSGDMVAALENSDVVEAVEVANRLHLMWVTAPDSPAGIPIATEYNALRDSAVDAFGTTAEALTEMDSDKMQQATVKLGHTTDLLTSFTDEIVGMTEELEALQD